MLEKGWNLSEKACSEFHRNKFSVREGYEKVFLGKDVKEFIRREEKLIDLLFDKRITWAEFRIKRMELAGLDLL